MSARFDPGHAAPDAVAAELAPDLAAIIGAPADLETVTALLAAAANVEVLTGPDGPYPNRRDAGARVYLTIRTGPAPAGPDQRT